MDSSSNSNATQPEVLETVTLADGGIVKKILRQGSGGDETKPLGGTEVTVHYVGRLLDGSVFDSSRDRREPFKFTIGEGQVIKGWDQGVATMKKGELAVLTCQPEFAYGARGSPPKIPANATLEFEVELLSWSDEEAVTGDNLVMRKLIKKGVNHLSPNDRAIVTVKMWARVKGAENKFIDEEKLELDLSDLSLPEGLEEALKDMHIGDRHLVSIHPEWGYGAKGNDKYTVPANAHLEYDIELVDFKNGKETWEMTQPERIAYGLSLKEIGNACYKSGQLRRAMKRYDQITKLFKGDLNDPDIDPSDKKAIQALEASTFSNLAACSLTAKQYDLTIDYTNKVLAQDSSNVRALIRRGKARAYLNMWDESLGDFEKALILDPSCTKEMGPIFQTVKQKMKALRDKERKVFGGFFNKVNLVSAAIGIGSV